MMPTILVVEDEPAILELLKVNLVDAGYDVRGAPDAETAQTLLTRIAARSPAARLDAAGLVGARVREAAARPTRARRSCRSSW
mgnify:CR=1 FL=1